MLQLILWNSMFRSTHTYRLYNRAIYYRYITFYGEGIFILPVVGVISITIQRWAALR